MLQRLAHLTTHVNPRLASQAMAEAADASARQVVVHDLAGNDWKLLAEETPQMMSVRSAGSAHWEPAPLPTSPVSFLAADASGFLWAAGARSLFRLNPRAAGTPGSTDPTRWDKVPLGDGGGGAEIVGLAAAPPPSDASVCLSMGSGEALWLGLADPTATTPTVFDGPPPPPGADPLAVWALHPARLPVGNHDHFVSAKAFFRWW
jgi:hypothetical protein